MSGPATPEDGAVETPVGHDDSVAIAISESRIADVGGFTVRRALPNRARRTIGAWCFVDHMGPADPAGRTGLDIGPHPHIGLQTVTWLLDGELLHRDSLGTEQIIRPGQLNLMTAGHGVSHAEESTPATVGRLHGLQLWIAQPAETRDGPPAFEHHDDLPRLELAGNATATVLIGGVEGATSPARRDTDLVGIDLDMRPGTSTVPLDPRFAYGLVVTSGAVTLESSPADSTGVRPGQLGALDPGRDELRLTASEPSRALLVGGVPFPEPVLMWWNYVARAREEITEAHREWTERSPRFGTVDTRLAAIDAAPPPWTRQG